MAADAATRGRARRALAALQRPWLAWAVAAVNLGGILYGFYYYLPQFRVTPWWLWPLVPDSPMAVLLATSALVLFALGRDRPVWNLVAMAAMVKVGVWTAVILPWFPDHFGFSWIPGGLACGGTGWDFRCADLNTYLFYLHLGMVAEALLLVGRYPRGVRAFVAVAALFVAIDVVDYHWPADHTGRGCPGIFPHTVPCDHHFATFVVTAAVSLAAVAALWGLQRWWTRTRQT